MKKSLAILLALILLASSFSACGGAPAEKNEPEETRTEETVLSVPEEPAEQDEEPHYKTYDDPYVEAIIVYAESMLMRKQYIQYDDTRFINKSGAWNYRWLRQKFACEDYTRQMTGYTNCAAFTYDCYFNALDYDIETWHTRALYYEHKDRHVFSYEVTGNETPEDKARIQKEFEDALRPADIIVYHKAGGVYGHAMLYVGDGEIIHSAAPGGGNYDYENRKEKSEPKGSINRITVAQLFAENKTNMWDRSRFAIVRPLKGYDKPIPEKSVNRVKNLQNVMVQKTSSRAVGQTVNPGELITYKIEIKNENNWAMAEEVRDLVPEYTTYVSGGDSVSGNEIVWNVKVPKGDTVTLEYTVKVNEDALGKLIYTDKGTVGGVPVKCPGVYVAHTLTEDELAKMAQAVAAAEGSALRGEELLNKIYNDALGKSAGIESFADVIKGCFKSSGESDYFFTLDPKGRYYGIAAPTLYGGYYVELSDDYGGVRTRGPQSVHLSAGDVLIMCADNDCKEIDAYIYNGSNALLSLTGDRVYTLELLESKNTLLSALGYNRFVVARPAMAF